jgi:L-cysteine:1D-myo-inositol 2-amino-2-deoxy-alpha-D-glucopyranoside ligase
VAREATPPADGLVAEVREALADDLDAPRALKAVDEWASGEGHDEGAPAVSRALDALLGVQL